MVDCRAEGRGWRASLAGVALVAAAVASLCTAAPATPQVVADVEALKQLPFEQLFELEVISVAKRPQRWLRAPAALAVITGEEIERAGVRTLPEALRLATGVHVARFDSRTWGISARGFNITSANKMLVMIDGRSVYTPLFSGVFWDVQNTLLEDVDRIEVIRGPGGSLWGANAVNGVINVVTQPASATQGGLAVAGAGDEQEAFGALRWGGELPGGHYRVYGQYDRRDAFVDADGASSHDDLWLGQGGFRADLVPGEDQRLGLRGDVYRGEIGHPVLAETAVDGGNLGADWSLELARGGTLGARAWYDNTSRRVPAQFEEERDTWDVEVQHRLTRGRHHLVWGGGYRWSEDHVLDSPLISWQPTSDVIWIANGFVNDEIALGERWRLVAGLKLEDQSTMDLEPQPSLRVAFDAGPTSTLWGGVARAVRAPTRLDRAVRIPGEPPYLVVGNPDFAPEEVVAYELGYRRLLGARGLLDVATFYNVYDDLRSQEPSAGGLPFVLENRLEGTSRGVEVSAAWDPLARLRLHGGASWLDVDLEPEAGSGDPTGGAGEGNDPELQWFLRADLDLPAGLLAGLWLRHVDELPNPVVPAYEELDLRLAWKPRPQAGWTVSLVGRNLLHDSRPELGHPAQRGEVERSVYGELSWRF
jgi:iron complex outermembrane receptor protein